MVTMSTAVKRNLLMAVGLVFFIMLAVSVQANQQTKTVKSDTAVSDVTVNINTATADELTVLPGVGAALAERIVKYRAEIGKFNTPSDLIAVKGVGEKKLDKMLNMIVVK